MARTAAKHPLATLLLCALLAAGLAWSGCGGGGGGGTVFSTPSTPVVDGTGGAGAAAAKKFILVGTLPDDVATGTSAAPAAPAPAGAPPRAAGFGAGNRFSLTVIDRADPALARELANVTIGKEAGGKYVFTAEIALGASQAKPLVAIKSAATGKVLLSVLPGVVPAIAEVPTDVRTIVLRGITLTADTTARATVAIDKNLEVTTPAVRIRQEERALATVVRDLSSPASAADVATLDGAVESAVSGPAGGTGTLDELAKAIETLNGVMSTLRIDEATKRALFEATGEKRTVPTMAGFLSDFVLALGNSSVQSLATDLGLATSVTVAGTVIDARTPDSLVTGAVSAAVPAGGGTPGDGSTGTPTLTSVTLTPRTVGPGDELSLTFSTNGPLIYPPTVTINGREARPVQVSDLSWLATTEVRAGDPATPTIRIDDLVGVTGAKGTPVTAVTDGSVPTVVAVAAAVAPPALDPPPGAYDSAQKVTLATRTAGAAIRYTLDGTEPSDTAGTLYAGPVDIPATATLRAVASLGGAVSPVSAGRYAIALPRVAAPAFSFPGGVQTRDRLAVELVSATAGAAIRYTLDGSEPTASNGAAYAGPIEIVKFTVVKAYAAKAGMADSAVAVAVYELKPLAAAVADPVIVPAAGIYDSTQAVVLLCGTAGATIRYTLDGTAPSYGTGKVFAVPFAVSSPTQVKAFAVKEGLADSAVVSAFLDVRIPAPGVPAAAAPVFNPAPGFASATVSVAILSATPGAAIRYSTDGVAPSATRGLVYAAPFLLAKPTTVMAVASKEGLADSPVATAFFDVNIPGLAPEPCAEPVIHPAGGAFAEAQSVMILSATRGASVRYTLDGSEPAATTGLLYAGPVTLDASAALRARAFKDGFLPSPTATALFDIARVDAPPARPLVTGVAPSAIYAAEVKPTWNEQADVTTTATLAKDGGAPAPFAKGAAVAATGAYALKVKAVKAGNGLSAETVVAFEIDATPPAKPVISGVANGATIPGYATLAWTDPANGTGVGKLLKAGAFTADFPNGSQVSGDGRYTLEVTVTSRRNGLTSKGHVAFTIDGSLPEAPVVTGVVSGAILAADAALDWNEQEGVTTAATLARNGGAPAAYAKGAAISADGAYVATVSATSDTGAVNRTTVAFTIDKAPPAAPVITGVNEGAVSGVAVRLAWDEIPGATTTARLLKDDEPPYGYAKSFPVRENGAYRLEVKAVKPNGLAATATRAFAVDTDPPAVPAVSVADGGDGTANVTWADPAGATPAAKIRRDGGAAADYAKGSPLSAAGTYAFELTVTKSANGLAAATSLSFVKGAAGLSVGPKAPVVTGVANGRTYGAKTAAGWEEVAGVATTATLAKDGGAPAAYAKNAPIPASGAYTLAVTARDEANSLENATVVAFTVDLAPPAAPVLSGIAPGAVTGQPVHLFWSKPEGALTSATLTSATGSRPYAEGEEVSADGAYTLAVRAVNKTNGLEASSTLAFAIDRTPPEAPVVSGVENGYATPLEVAPTWDVPAGVDVTARLAKDGGAWVAFAPGTTVSAEGRYALEATAVKRANGLSAATELRFEIRRDFPAEPILFGLPEKPVATDVRVSWAAAEGTTVTVEATNDRGLSMPYAQNLPLTAEGEYLLMVTARNDLSGLATTRGHRFVIDKTPPPAPALSGVANGALSAAPVEVTWAVVPGVSYAALVSRDAGPDYPYMKGFPLAAAGRYIVVVEARKANGLGSRSARAFTVDPARPEPPAISLIALPDGASALSWNDPEGATATATLAKDGGAPAPYTRETTISENGNYVLVVTAARAANGLTASSSLTFNRTPEGVEKAPAAPRIAVTPAGASAALAYGALSAEPVTLDWSEEPGATYAATLTRTYPDPQNPGATKSAAMAAARGATLDLDGDYLLEIAASRAGSSLTNGASFRFTVDRATPPAPALRGIADGAVSAADVALDWDEAPGCSYAAVIASPSKDIYFRRVPVTAEGLHVVTVTARRLANGKSASASLSFTIDKTPPARPEILNVTDRMISAGRVSPAWSTPEGVDTTATVSRDGGPAVAHESGDALDLEGAYILVVTARKRSNGLSATSRVSFTVNRAYPAPPTLSGAPQGEVAGMPVRLSWNEQAGATTTAKLYKDGQEIPYAKGAALAEDGRYRLAATATGANGLANSSELKFSIDLAPPALPPVEVVDNGNGTVHVTWVDDPLVATSATLERVEDGLPSPPAYERDRLIAENGTYRFALACVKRTNGLSARTVFTFAKNSEGVKKGPVPAEVRGVVDGGIYAGPVKPEWSSWQDLYGINTRSTLRRIGAVGIPLGLSSGSTIEEDGSYVLEIVVASPEDPALTATTVVAFAIDSTPSTVALTYSSNPASAGPLVITATFSKPLYESEAAILVTLPGGIDLGLVRLTPTADRRVYTHTLWVEPADGQANRDGTAKVAIYRACDLAGRTFDQPTNATFTIDTASPKVDLVYAWQPPASRAPARAPITIDTLTPTALNQYPNVTSMNPLPTFSITGPGASDPMNTNSVLVGTSTPATPAEPSTPLFMGGKLTITALFSADVKAGQTPRISVEGGTMPVTGAEMTPGVSRRIWTYMYDTARDGEVEGMAGERRVTIAQANDAAGNAFTPPTNNLFRLDTKRPNYTLGIGANPAPAGFLTLTARFSEPMRTDRFAMTVLQPGAARYAAAVSKSSAEPNAWTGVVDLKTADGANYLDGTAAVALDGIFDAAGNAPEPVLPSSRFRIKTVPTYKAAVVVSPSPAKAGKATITATFEKDFPSDLTPLLTIDQPGTADFLLKPMTAGATRRIWTFDYVPNADNGKEYKDGLAALRIADAAGEEATLTSGDSFAIDTTPPTLKFLESAAGATLVGDSTRAVKWTLFDLGGLPATPVKLEVYNGTAWSVAAAALANSGSYTWTVPRLDTGAAKLRLTAADLAGNATVVESGTFIVSTNPANWAAGYPKAGALDATSAPILVKADRDAKVHYALVPSALRAATPAPADLKAGTVPGVAAVDIKGKGTVNVTANVEASFTVSGLAEKTAYDLFAVTETTLGLLQLSTTKLAITTPPPAPPIDTTGYPKVEVLTTITPWGVKTDTLRCSFKSGFAGAGKIHLTGFKSRGSYDPFPPTAITASEVKNARWGNKYGDYSRSFDAQGGEVVTRDTPNFLSGSPSGTDFRLYTVNESGAGVLSDPVLLDVRIPSLTLDAESDVIGITQTAIPLKITADMNCTVWLVAVAAVGGVEPASPTAAQIKAGKNASGAPAAATMSFAATMSSPYIKTIGALAVGTHHTFFACGESESGTLGPVAFAGNVTRGALAANLMYPSQKGYSSTTDMMVCFYTNANCTVYSIVLAEGRTTPTQAQIKRGLDAYGFTAFAKGDIVCNAYSAKKPNDRYGGWNYLQYKGVTPYFAPFVVYYYLDAAGATSPVYKKTIR